MTLDRTKTWQIGCLRLLWVKATGWRIESDSTTQIMYLSERNAKSLAALGEIQ